MYGSIDENEAKKLLPAQSKERRRDFALRRQNASRTLSIPKLPRETSVFGALFGEDKKAPRTATPSAAPSTPSHYSFVYTLLNPHSKRWQAILFKRFIATVIVVDLVLFVLSTDRSLSEEYEGLFYVSEGIVSCIFLIEYILRLVTCIERPKFRQKGPIWGRIQYMGTSAALIDLLATAPFFLEPMVGVDLPKLTYVRVLRLGRLLKTSAIVRALDACYRVVYYNREILSVAMVMGILLVLITAVLLYYLRPAATRKNEVDDLDEFHSIPATLYMSTLMLTGQGGPDPNELPWYTRSVVLLTAVFSIAMFAIPSSMLTWGFEAEAERMAKRARRRMLKQKSSQSNDISSTSSEEISTDEEYFRIIAGEDIEQEGGSQAAEEDEQMKELQSFFQQADSDMDGTLTMAEMWKMRGLTSPGGEGMNKRMQALERKMEENSHKLDKILEILQKEHRPRGIFHR